MILHRIEELSQLTGPVHLAIGVFDGVHRGHQKVIANAVAGAHTTGGTSVVVTFDPHPARVLRPDRAPRLITSTSHKVAILQSLGIDHILLIPFDQEFADIHPAQFIEELASACRPLHSISVGRQWCFGNNRAGNLSLLDKLGSQFGFAVTGIPEVEIDGKPLSSTLIRSAIETGQLETAHHYLGRPFTLLGTVEHGLQIGRTLGFPTANLRCHNEQFPPNGVYLVTANLEAELFSGIINIGTRPTLDIAIHHRLLELHIFDFNRDIYGKDIEIELKTFLRPEIRFNGLEALKEQIKKDIAAARHLL